MSGAHVVGRLRQPGPALTVALVAGLAAWVGVPVGPEAAAMLGITLFCVALWILTPIPPSYTGLICVGLVGVAFSPELALVGFQSPATWLIGFGLLVGEATRRSGLAAWAGRWIVAHAVPAGAREDPVRAYVALVWALSMGAIGLAVLVPSTLVRVIVLAPVLRETGDLFDSRTARVGIFLAPLFATFYGSVGIFTAGLPNVIIAGITESLGGPSISWTEWTALLAPVFGLGRAALVAAVMSVAYRPDPDSSVSLPDAEPATPSPAARRMFLFLLAGVAVWTTDFLHGLHPVFGAIVVVVLAFLPRVGVVEFADATAEVDYSILFFLGGVFAIGEGLARTGFADLAAESLLGLVPADGPLVLVLGFVFAVTLALTFLMEGLAVASVVTPVIVSFAMEAGLPVEPVVMTEAIALVVYFFPYQSAVLVAILAEDVVDAPELVRVTTILSIATILVLLPLQFAVFALLY